MQVAFYLAGEITQVKESIPWVRCASGNVYHRSAVTPGVGRDGGFWESQQKSCKLSRTHRASPEAAHTPPAAHPTNPGMFYIAVL